MPVQALKQNKLHDQIAELLIELILAGDFSPGDRLPSERDLSEQLKVSRGSLRQALVVLELSGVLEIRTSSGIFVAQDALSNANRLPSLDDSGRRPLDIIQARRAVEGETAYLAAKLGSEADIERIRATALALEEGERRYDLRHPSDRQFHREIARASQNTVLADMVRDLWNMQRGKYYQRLEDHFSTAEMRDYAIRDHREILAAITAGDPDLARRMMHRHMDRIYNNLATSALELPKV